MRQLQDVVDELTDITERQADLISRLFDLLSQHIPAEEAEEIAEYYGIERGDGRWTR